MEVFYIYSIKYIFDGKNRINKKQINTIVTCFLLFQKEYLVELTEICWKHLFSSRKKTSLLSLKSTELLQLILWNFSLSTTTPVFKIYHSYFIR